MGGGASIPSKKGLFKWIQDGNVKKIRNVLEDQRLGGELLELLCTKNDDNRTPLMAAMFEGYSGDNFDIVMLLISERAGLELTNKYGQTPLLIVCSAGKQKGVDKVVQALLSAGADPTACDKTGMTSLHKLASAGRIEGAMDLIEAGAPLDAVDSFGFTALHYAVEKGRMETVRMLLDAGCKWNCATNDGRTPIAFSIENGHEEILRLFTDLGGFAASLERVPEGEQYEGERCDPWIPKFDRVKEKRFWLHKLTGDVTWENPYEGEDAEPNADDHVKKERTWLQERKSKVTLANMGLVGDTAKEIKKYSWEIGERQEQRAAWHSRS
jgi:hypothetical protein